MPDHDNNSQPDASQAPQQVLAAGPQMPGGGMPGGGMGMPQLPLGFGSPQGMPAPMPMGGMPQIPMGYGGLPNFGATPANPLGNIPNIGPTSFLGRLGQNLMDPKKYKNLFDQMNVSKQAGQGSQQNQGMDGAQHPLVAAFGQQQQQIKGLIDQLIKILGQKGQSSPTLQAAQQAAQQPATEQGQQSPLDF